MVQIGSQGLAGELTRVPDARGLVVFALGSGGSRHSPRDHMVAQVLQGYRFNTLLFDLLTVEEGADRACVFDIDLLSRRLGDTLNWARAEEPSGQRCAGLFAASTGAAAALQAAARHPDWVSGVVSGGGRPDLAGPWLGRVQAPTLLIVGGRDSEVLQLNQAALRALRCQCRLEVVPGATHLFEETGAMETVAHLAGDWFANHLPLQVH
jgi:putative phosphoribosyl transferase